MIFESAMFMPFKFLPVISQRIKTYVPELLGTTTTSGAALMSWQVQAQWGLSVFASIAALVVAFYTIRSLMRKERELK